MLAPPDTEVRMGFLDKLLGRSKEAAGDLGQSAKDTGEKATDAVDRDEGESQVTESEHRLDDARDQTLRDEGRMP